ncbi:hypothetical protein RJO15_18580 [Herbaspirillum huttiense F1]|jgi:hypothetical protein|uniref:Uncharacterized protein n=1 Tax=Herbaspirillum huttiense subsp. lycopersici TaxID=3074428 RepID=A0ABU2EQT6_9BURK|nr:MULTISPECIES: hypothetical protein [Herbaspirillum]MBP1314898.1 hypothetical protein [Herbaspirillum sp. 1130]MCO4858872.1 hypothetical protein [Herbaspirillum sp. WGmk3]MDR6742068.1 hypothetical protein [Herbaspirillum sp. 1173]MDR9850525.1 hypothetical protein [Herbaspirillum huttiense SE1]MDT0357802.1 hypothetical protein [Herbaspirillum huttiense F1]
MQDLLPHPDLAQLRALAADSAAITIDCNCRAADSSGWISLPLSLPETQLVDVATLIADPYDEPTFTEYHPQGTRYASPEAPIAPAWYPYNRCNIARCTQCARHYLRYMEAGGYFVDRRIRSLNAPALIVEAA